MKKYCYFNGKIVESKKVGLPINDIGIIRGHAVFDYFRSYNGKPFRISDYYKRFKRSAENIGLKVPISQNELEKTLKKLLQKNKDKDSAFRLVMTGGPSSTNIKPEKKSNFYIMAEELPNGDPKYYEKGAKLITDEYQRLFPESKTCNYIEAVKLQPKKEKADAQEILYYNKGKVLECATSNIFIVKNKKLMTPKDNILNGITRKVVTELAKKNKIKSEQKDISLKQLFSADEVFITSSGKSRMLPIVKIDSKKVANGKVGEITKILTRAFRDYTENY